MAVVPETVLNRHETRMCSFSSLLRKIRTVG